MNKTPISNFLKFAKFGNEGESMFDDDFFNGLLEDQSDEPVTEPEPLSLEAQAPVKVDPKPEEVLVETSVDPLPESQPASEAQPDPVKTDVEVKEEPKQEITQPAAETQQMNLDQIRGELEKAYAISDEQADLLTTDPQKAFPAMAANLHMQIMSQVLTVLERSLPQQIQATQTRQKEYQQVEEQFKQLYPKLDLGKKDVYEAVATAASLVKTQFPQMAMEEKVKRVGLLAQSLLGNIPQVESTAPAAQEAAPKPAPVSPAPARGSSGKLNPTQPTQWDQLLTEIIDED